MSKDLGLSPIDFRLTLGVLLDLATSMEDIEEESSLSHSPSDISLTVHVWKMLWLCVYGTILFLCKGGSCTKADWVDMRPAGREDRGGAVEGMSL